MVTVRERAVTFGPGQALVGIETRAVERSSGGAPEVGLPAVILLNAGVVYRVGPHRLTVNLARRFARAGHLAFRFDLAGLGDSRARKGSTSYESRVIEDVHAAMDQLQKAYGIDRFILGGLCSGADNSLRVALVDPRVKGVILLDPYAYRTPGFYLRHYLARVGRVRSWVGATRRGTGALVATARARLRRRGTGGANGDGADTIQVPSGPQYARYHPPRQLFAAQLRQLIDRGVGIYIAYSGSLNAVYNYANQFSDAFRAYGIGNSDLRCTFEPTVNHTYTELAAQRQLGDALVDWAAALAMHPGAVGTPAAAGNTIDV
ncbi:MAG TPA: alpha/beta fold hydrolase [Polyangia bacterium]|nr:alpha/beta fold hydrolase [Polyangia bacterium]